MTLQIKPNELKTIIKASYKQIDEIDNKKIPLIIYGTFGIGKSWIVKDTALEIANKKGKKFIDWNLITLEEKEKIIKNPKDYFVFIDIRLSEYDISDLKGLPDFKKDEDCIIWKSPFFTKLLENPNSDGFLFFDEINLATPLIISSVYKILYDRIINDNKIGDEWLILCAGNLDEDKAYTHELASPVRDRALEVQLKPPTIQDWSNWAMDNKINTKIIGFLNWKPSYLHKIDFNDRQKFTTPRGWARVSQMTKGIEKYDLIELLAQSCISEGIAIEYVAFCKIEDKINLNDIIKNPKKLKELEDIGMKYFVVSSIGEKYKEDKNLDLEKVMAICEVLDEIKNQEFVALLMRLCYKFNPSKFKKEFPIVASKSPLINKYFDLMTD